VASRSTEEAITPSVAIARDHLGGDRLRPEPHRLGDVLLHARIDLRESADRSRDRAGCDFLTGEHEALAGAAEFCIGVGELEPERHGLGMNAVRAADGRGHFVLEGALLQRRQQFVDIREQQIGRARQLHVQAGVEHVGGGHALVHEACLGADDLRQMGGEGDDVVLGFAFDLVDPGDIEDGVPGLGPNDLRRFLWNYAEFGLRVSRMGLDFEPDLEARLGLPDRGHFRAGVAGYHRRLWGFKGLRGALAEQGG